MRDRPRLPITPDTKVGPLLEAYPELEAVLMAQAPAFANLTNPLLRRTVARVATLAQAARVGGVDVRTLVLALRTAVGQGDAAPHDAQDSSEAIAPGPPDWLSADRVVATVDAEALLAAGLHPLAEVVRVGRDLADDQVVCVTSPFVPAPLAEVLRQQGFEVVTFASGVGVYTTCVRRARAGGA